MRRHGYPPPEKLLPPVAVIPSIYRIFATLGFPDNLRPHALVRLIERHAVRRRPTTEFFHDRGFDITDDELRHQRSLLQLIATFKRPHTQPRQQVKAITPTRSTTD